MAPRRRHPPPASRPPHRDGGRAPPAPTRFRLAQNGGGRGGAGLARGLPASHAQSGAGRSAAAPARRGEAAAAAMDVFLMIRRHKTTIFTDAKESSTVFELKRIVEGILKRPPDEQRLYKDDQLLDDGKTLGECGFTSQTARPQAPATVGLAFRADDAFEALRIEPFSSPPELPDVMKPQDSGSSANEQVVQ
ncbi:elongin-B [Ochotona curzoniae]|uniref:elongin-B n=1 Tax=Ochotona curzoniae TaxID=130825 RepID=UPI001B34C980|nr:elongin-B [Ochotona curzoniae]XP_040853575.1 elongin-B [Ochotona curzoniae]